MGMEVHMRRRLARRRTSTPFPDKLVAGGCLLGVTYQYHLRLRHAVLLPPHSPYNQVPIGTWMLGSLA